MYLQPTEEETKDVNILEFSHNRTMMKDQNIEVFDNFLTVHEILAHCIWLWDGKNTTRLCRFYCAMYCETI